MSKIIQLSIPQEPEIDSGNLLIEDYIEEKSESDTPMEERRVEQRTSRYPNAPEHP